MNLIERAKEILGDESREGLDCIRELCQAVIDSHKTITHYRQLEESGAVDVPVDDDGFYFSQSLDWLSKFAEDHAPTK